MIDLFIQSRLGIVSIKVDHFFLWLLQVITLFTNVNRIIKAKNE